MGRRRPRDGAGADAVHDELVASASWEQGRVFRYERWVDEPRLGGFQRGDQRHPALVEMQTWLSRRYRVTFDGVALAQYRHEREQRGLPPRPRAALPRRHRHRCADDGRPATVADATDPRTTGPRVDADDDMTDVIDLAPASGDLFVMGGRCQADWLHAVPKVRGRVRSRVSAQWRWTSRRGHARHQPVVLRASSLLALTDYKRAISTESTTRTEPTSRAFDPDALREKYRRERDKRLRADGNDQYHEVTGEFAHYRRRPVRRAGFDARPAAPTRSTSLIVGGGFGGLLAGARLREAGVDDIRIVEKGGDFGGTWYWNRYPGAPATSSPTSTCRCSKRSATSRREKYVQRARDPRAQPAPSASTSTSTSSAASRPRSPSMRWDDDAGRWIVTTDRGDAMRARFVCMANGPLHRPKLPGIAGHRARSRATRSTPAAGTTTTPAATPTGT